MSVYNGDPLADAMARGELVSIRSLLSQTSAFKSELEHALQSEQPLKAFEERLDLMEKAIRHLIEISFQTSSQIHCAENGVKTGQTYFFSPEIAHAMGVKKSQMIGVKPEYLEGIPDG